MFDFSLLKKMFDAALAYLSKEISRATGKVTTAIESDRGMKTAVDQQTRMISSLVSRLETAIGKIQEPKFTGEVMVDTSTLEAELSTILNQLKGIKLPSLSNVESLLKQLIAKDPTSAIKELVTSIGKMQGVSFPSTIKIDEMQMRTIANASAPSMMVQGGTALARNVLLTNLALTSTATEYSHTFKANTIAWTIKLRDQGTLAYYSFTTGKLPTIGGGGDGTNYATIPQNFLQSKDGVDWSGKTIYLGAESASQVCEITTYQM